MADEIAVETTITQFLYSYGLTYNDNVKSMRRLMQILDDRERAEFEKHNCFWMYNDRKALLIPGSRGASKRIFAIEKYMGQATLYKCCFELKYPSTQLRITPMDYLLALVMFCKRTTEPTPLEYSLMRQTSLGTPLDSIGMILSILDGLYARDIPPLAEEFI